MPSEDVLISYILKSIACRKDYKGKRVLVTAGPTQEAIDPVRFITNHSTGKMGYAAAYRATLRGADVTLITGKTSLTPPPFVNTISVTSAEDMYNAVINNFEDTDVIIMSAAVADYYPENVSDSKIKKHDESISIRLKRTKDILSEICRKKRDNQFVCGFSMETENLIENSRKKLDVKNCDMIVANSLKCPGAGFGTDTNVITLITKNELEEYPIMSKDDAADKILDFIIKSTNFKTAVR
ncbi:bifunctional phosphopantothenoylcysteine decarboxylase/phosphopantothenate--cysteine ligase CoaBC, partial [Porcipelethomonas sp.]|uniref:bifunctional phosphopantothenoylcysteine decarboxylase/phosphopantothenate--cysteine ligase CoaBC n=1 Tax=Porcipelethomonas sp. TaxID=2981675 RepID=UPI003EF1F4DD